jgi:nucleoporin NUP159
LLAAAGPDLLVVATTAKVRAAFGGTAGTDNIVEFTPDMGFPVPRLSHVVFTADGSHLVLAAEEGGGLQVHKTDNLINGNNQPVFELSTDGTAIRSIVPNPALESAHLLAVIMSNGHLMIADLQERKFSVGASRGPSLKDGVTSTCWSVKGRQLAAGLQDGTAIQLDPTGAVKAVIPRPPESEANLQGTGPIHQI